MLRQLLNYILEAPNEGDFTTQEVIERAVDRFNKMTLIGGVPITNYVEARPINNESIALVGADFTFFKLRLKDNGDYTALSLVQAQYPNFKVELEDNRAGFSTYVILAPDATVLADYVETVTSVLPECDECPEGFTLVDGLCTNTTEVEATWTEGNTCKASTEVYRITLADDEYWR